MNRESKIAEIVFARPELSAVVMDDWIDATVDTVWSDCRAYWFARIPGHVETVQMTFGGGGERHRFKFGNGYGASVVCHQHSYGGPEGMFEVAVLRDGSICYDTPITSDVIGWVPLAGVRTILESIRALED